MKLVIQRVQNASVSINKSLYSSIEKGLLILFGVGEEDESLEKTTLAALSKKLCNLRIFPNQADKLDLSLKDIEGEILLVSQFTLYAHSRKGRRPDFMQAAKPKLAELIYEDFALALESELGKKISLGKFGAKMEKRSQKELDTLSASHHYPR